MATILASAPAITLVASLLAGGCSATVTNAASSEPQGGPVVENVDHEACDGKNTELMDAKGDGKADVKRVLDGSGHELCRVTDVNHDGRADLYEYFDSAGTVRRREADYDNNGIIDSVEIYEGGKLVKREYDTTGQHRVDTWDYFDKGTGKRLRRERDTTNDGRVDQWWTWDGDKITIAVDHDGDGKPDPAGVIVLGEKAVDAKMGDAKMGDAKTAPPPPVAPPADSSAPSAAPKTPSPPKAGAKK